ncbi:MAG TPA: hypothetical protein VFV77_04185, partial [Gammaproteobacteria bacterium]|nr:hypothetical protein [Gammaproteobacteria bacterium]
QHLVRHPRIVPQLPQDMQVGLVEIHVSPNLIVIYSAMSKSHGKYITFRRHKPNRRENGGNVAVPT